MTTTSNSWIGGSSGAGKTFTLQCLGGRLRQQGRKAILLSAWYFYGMFINSIRLGNRAVFGSPDEPVASIWGVNPFLDLLDMENSDAWNLPLEEIAEIAGLPLDEVKKLQTGHRV